MEQIKHECGVAMVRLLQPLSYYKEKYGTWMYGLNKLYLMMEKQHNRGQEAAGLAALKLQAEPGDEFMFRERAQGNTAIQEIFAAVHAKFSTFTPEELADVDFAGKNIPFVGEIYMGHLRYSTTGKRGLSYVHPFLRRNNWRAKNLCLCANFNMTNVQEIFDHIAVKGQHPRMLSDTYLLLEQLGHRLDREAERCFAEAESLGLTDRDITEHIESRINVANILKESAPVWDGGYVVCGITGSGETFVLRDPWGIRPAFYYKDDEVFALASERPVLQTTFGLEANDIVELQPGQAIMTNRKGELRIEQILPAQKLASCSFERVYFSRGSDIDIYQERKEMGRRLVPSILKAINNEVDNTVFSYIPNTAEAAYYGLYQGFEEYLNHQKTQAITALLKDPAYSSEAGKTALETRIAQVLSRHIRAEKVAWKDIKMRTFIAEGNSRNDLAAHVYDITYGSVLPHVDNLVVIDDSIVRGTTLRESILRILNRLHPKRIVIVSSSPQVRYPDYYGIDMANMDEFIAFRAAIALHQERGTMNMLTNLYHRCKSQENLPKEKVQNFIRELYAPFTEEDLNIKMIELLRPTGVDTEIHMVYLSIEDLHKACPNSPGDWYFSGYYPTPGGNKCVNAAFIRYMETHQAELLS
ncbi:glutamine amidotransferase [Alloprevotella sp. oral taxon 473]|uniref:glutamine amidotransferase n=1 Tax=Alloprevotella sp. oral taxon 473 TaxID=712469 RepID=UPI0002A2E10D|nr:glutamine amidotransferase [Alloprevotella sp. oral taxon 473]EKX88818.1 class II glutamine amidotransferase [Alloprevotella sp. oral taxon 473 str. F0040]